MNVFLAHLGCAVRGTRHLSGWRCDVAAQAHAALGRCGFAAANGRKSVRVVRRDAGHLVGTRQRFAARARGLMRRGPSCLGRIRSRCRRGFCRIVKDESLSVGSRSRHGIDLWVRPEGIVLMAECAASHWRWSRSPARAAGHDLSLRRLDRFQKNGPIVLRVFRGWYVDPSRSRRGKRVRRTVLSGEARD